MAWKGTKIEHRLPKPASLVPGMLRASDEFGAAVQRIAGAIASGRNKPATASDSPLASLRGCGPKPPPCRPFLAGVAMRNLSGKTKSRASRWTRICATPHRTQRSRVRSMPVAAADAGSNVFATSIQQQTFPAWVICARNESATEVRPEHSGPTNSLMAPIGSPPPSKSSSASIPVAATGRIIFGIGRESRRNLLREGRFDLQAECRG